VGRFGRGFAQLAVGKYDGVAVHDFEVRILRSEVRMQRSEGVLGKNCPERLFCQNCDFQSDFGEEHDDLSSDQGNPCILQIMVQTKNILNKNCPKRPKIQASVDENVIWQDGRTGRRTF
jgi:hypothetical protein